MNTISFVNQEVIKLWKKCENELKNIDKNLKVPLIYPDLKKDVLLFIGINPSFSSKGFRKIVKDTSYSSLDPTVFYHWDNRKNFEREIEKALEIERLAREKLDFFQKFPEIAGETFSGDTSKWEHIDLFFNRETSQKDFEKKILNNKDMESFVSAQLDLSKRLINYVCPKAIVIANARASEVFEEKLKGEFPLIWHKEYGYHTTVLKNKSMPVFLASMLTGSRAMDGGSYKRLKWHIKKALEKTSKLKQTESLSFLIIGYSLIN